MDKNVGILTLQTGKGIIRALWHGPVPVKETIRQLSHLLTNIFWTMVGGSVTQGLFLAWILGHYGQLFGGIVWAGSGVVEGVLRETAVLMTAILFACKGGTGFSVELSSMNLDRQVDALELMGVDKYQYLVLPRVLASIIALPVLVILSSGFAIASSFTLMNLWFGLSVQQFLETAFKFVYPFLITSSLIRSLVIGFSISVTSCAVGLARCEGATDLGIATTRGLIVNVFAIFLLNLGIEIIFTILRL